MSSTLRTVVVKHFYFFFKVVKNLKIFWTRWERYFGDHGFSSLVNIAHFTNSHVEALYLWKDLCSWKNQKRKVVISKKMGPKKKERYHSVKKRKKNPFEKATNAGGAPRRRRFRTKKSPSNQTLPYIMLKTRFPFRYASISQQLPRIVIWKAVCRLVVWLLITFCSFFYFCRGFGLCHRQLCSLLCLSPRRSTERWRLKKENVSAMSYFSREILIYRHWRLKVNFARAAASETR